MRLINGDALKYAIDKRMDDSTDESFSEGLAEAMIEIDFMPTIVEFEGDINKVIVKGEEYHRIVRCKDCKHGSPNGKYGCTCYHYTLYKTHEMKPEDFCSRAERRSDD